MNKLNHVNTKFPYISIFDTGIARNDFSILLHGQSSCQRTGAGENANIQNFLGIWSKILENKLLLCINFVLLNIDLIPKI